MDEIGSSLLATYTDAQGEKAHGGCTQERSERASCRTQACSIERVRCPLLPTRGYELVWTSLWSGRTQSQCSGVSRSGGWSCDEEAAGLGDVTHGSRDLPSQFLIWRQHTMLSLNRRPSTTPVGTEQAHTHVSMTVPHTLSFRTSVPLNLLLCGLLRPLGNRSGG